MALPFVEWDERGKRFRVNDAAAAYLGQLDSELGEQPGRRAGRTHVSRPRLRAARPTSTPALLSPRRGGAAA